MESLTANRLLATTNPHNKTLTDREIVQKSNDLIERSRKIFSRYQSSPRKISPSPSQKSNISKSNCGCLTNMDKGLGCWYK